MKPLMKKLVLTMAAVSLLILGGCSSNDQKNDKKGSDSETKKEEVKLIKNDRYVEPLNPSEQQIKAFNSLSAAVEKNPDHAISEEEAKQVAVNFVYDFFTLANKKSRSDIGGLQYLPSDSIREYIEFAEAYYYGNYPTIVNEYFDGKTPKKDIGQSPLQVAIKCRHFEIIDLLIAHGADINFMEDPTTVPPHSTCTS